MSRALQLLFLLVALLAPAVAQEAHHSESGDPEIWWKWANFAILAIALGYLGRKSIPAFFRSRTEQIQRGIAEAAKLKQDAEARAQKVEMRLATLQHEVEEMRKEARKEMAKEGERLRNETERHLARLRAQSEQEIASYSKHVIHDLKAYSAQLAIDLAEQRIRARMSSEVQNGLVQQYVRGLESQGGGWEGRP